MIERKLEYPSLTEMLEDFESIRRKFYEDDEDLLIVEVPRGSHEVWVVELENTEATEKLLKKNGYIKQTVRARRSWE